MVAAVTAAKLGAAVSGRRRLVRSPSAADGALAVDDPGGVVVLIGIRHTVGVLYPRTVILVSVVHRARMVSTGDNEVILVWASEE
jgi:hypothetical protein